MRVVITTTLNNNLFHAKLTPLVRARPDLEVLVVTDREGPPITGVRWIWPQGWLRHLGELGARLALLVATIAHPRTRLVMAYGVIPHGLYAVWLARLRNVPVYLHFIGGPAEIRFADDVRVLENRIVRRSRHPHFWERLARGAARRADHIFVPGAATRAFLLGEGFAAETVSILHSTIDPERYFQATAARDIDVLISAQLCARKRPLFTLRVLALIRARMPAVRFCWLGDGIMHDEFAAGLRDLDLRDVIDWRATDQVGQFYRRAKIFLLCSINEGLSLACLEAMGCGVVPVVSDCGDMRDAVIAGTTGYLLDPDADEAQFAEAIIALLADPQRTAVFSTAAICLAESAHCFAVAEGRWREILATALPPRTNA